jgi:hypothetical protein
MYLILSCLYKVIIVFNTTTSRIMFPPGRAKRTDRGQTRSLLFPSDLLQRGGNSTTRRSAISWADLPHGVKMETLHTIDRMIASRIKVDAVRKSFGDEQGR